MKRRTFLHNSAFASTAFMVPSFLRGLDFGARYRSRQGKILVIVQLSGGNDGLNTVVPYHNDIYYQKRPQLGIPKSDVLPISDEMGLHPSMTGLRTLYDEGLLSIVNSVGYPNPDRSHFRSMDIWHSGSDADQYWNTGWLGRYLDNACAGSPCDSAHSALQMDDNLALALKGQHAKGFAMSNPQQLKKTTDNRFLKSLASNRNDHVDENVAYLYKTMIDTQSSADYLYARSKVHQSSEEYPNTNFGRDLKQVAELITADTDTRIYYVSLTGFDTHANQQNVQARLLQQYSEGMQAFVQDLQRNGLFNDTLIMTFSEFGRRVEQNASRGTDHGTANNLFLLGGKLRRPGFYNEAPDLTHLEQGDLIYDIDFRQIYSSILRDWLQTDASQVLGAKFDALPLL